MVFIPDVPIRHPLLQISPVSRLQKQGSISENFPFCSFEYVL